MIKQRGTDWLRLSSPSQDRPLVPAVERIAKHLRASAADLESLTSLDFEGLFRPNRPGLGFTIAEADRQLRSAWALIGEWLVAWAVEQHDGTASLGETHAWFWSGHKVADLGKATSHTVIPTPITTSTEVRALLPYLLDPSSVATRRSVLRAQASHRERVSRKQSGAYYTPGDVAAHMVRKLAESTDPPATTWIDPAQGSGVFLRAVLGLATDYETARESLYGVDIDPYAAEASSFVLTAEDLLACPDGDAPWQRWHRFRRNFTTGNSLFLGSVADGLFTPDGSWEIGDAFPEIGSDGFSRVIANPPYIRLPAHRNNHLLGSLHPVTGKSASADISPIFVEIGLNLLAKDGAMSVVLPLSAVTSTRSPFPELRGRLAEELGQVEFESFDRMPDSLFGDDIKTRNSIITVRRGNNRDVTSTSLHRWTSRKRERAFTGATSVSVTGLFGVPTLLPKIGSDWELCLYRTCFNQDVSIGSWLISRRTMPISEAQHVDDPHWSQMVALAPTAYNFLGLVRDASQAALDGHDSENAIALLSFDSARKASAAYALLASRVGFWLWHVTGDGFHTTAKLPWYVPAPVHSRDLEQLADLGEKLWGQASKHPLVNVNRGKTTVSYPTWVFPQLIDRIDRAVDAMLGTDVADRLAEWHERLIVVDADSDRMEKKLRKMK